MSNRPYLLLILAPLIWGGHAVIGKLAVNEIAPMTFALLRWIVAFIILLPFALPKVKQEWQQIKMNFPLLFTLGMLGFAGFNMLNYTALAYTSALNSALIQATTPMLILLINTFLLRQPFAPWQLVGMVMAFFGVLIIISKGQLHILQSLALNKGDLLMLLACFLYAGYSAALRYKPKISWLSFIFILAFSALLTALPFALYEIATSNKPVLMFSYKSLLLIIYVGLFASIISQLAYAKGVSLIGAARAGFAINLVPIFGALLAILILNETFAFFHLLGLLLVMGGITLSERNARRKLQ